MAYDLNGSNQSLQTASTPVTAVPLTIAAWVNLDSSSIQTVCNISTNTLSNFASFRLRINSSNNAQALQLNTDASQAGVASSSGTLSNGTWHHVSGVFSSNSSRFVFLDGTKSSEDTTTTSTTGLSVITMGYTYESTGTGSTQQLDGRIAETAIWNAALTDAEILSLARGFTPDQIRPQSLQFYAPLVRGLQDVRGGRTITNNNSATVATHPRIIGGQ